MPGYSPKLPLTSDPGDGLLLNKTYQEVAKQNLKMLLLTLPGERIMDPEFGVGLPAYFFENIDPSTINVIKEKVIEQVEKYLPYINLLNVSINDDQKKLLDENTISLVIDFSIANIGQSDKIVLDLAGASID
tara:strand:- start:415 stop:810 length:396 start_codon:yes stop_codon:yes gene_type:complete